MTFAHICDDFPNLEYFFGCYLPQYWSVVQAEPDRIIRRFALRKPADLAKTVEQLHSLIRHCAGQPNPEDVAATFLEILDCPYYPRFYGRGAMEWLRSVCDTLARYIRPADRTGKPPRGAFVVDPLLYSGPLGLPDDLDVLELPLNLPNVFLTGYAGLTAPAQMLELYPPLKHWSVALREFPAVFVEPQPLKADLERLLETHFVD